MGRVHGDSLQLSSGETRSDMFKSLAIVCLAAAAVAEPDAKAEADAALLYGGYGYGLESYPCLQPQPNPQNHRGSWRSVRKGKEDPHQGWSLPHVQGMQGLQGPGWLP